MKLKEAAEILANGCCGVSVYGTKAVDASEVRRIASEWLKLTKDIQPAAPPAKRSSWWRRLLGSSEGERNER